MAGCKIVVVGCNHGVQARDRDALFGDSDQAKKQKTQFAQLISALIKENQLEFVGEEWGLASMTIAHVAADENDKIPWANINTTLEQLDTLKIPRDYLQGAYSVVQKEQWSRQREPVMLLKLLECRRNAERYLVVCGFEHMGPLAGMLGKICESVELVDCRKQPWYDDAVFSD